MNISQRLKILNQSGKTVFRLKDMRNLWQDKELNTKIAAQRMVQKQFLYKLAKGYYALDNQDYNLYEY